MDSKGFSIGDFVRVEHYPFVDCRGQIVAIVGIPEKGDDTAMVVFIVRMPSGRIVQTIYAMLEA